VSATARWQPYGLAAAALLLPGLLWLGNPAVALLTGAGLTLTLNRQPLAGGGRLGSYALQTAIVLLGLTLDVQTLWRLSAEYTGMVAAFVGITLLLGLALGRALSVEPAASKLVSSGTAICGGTAIATLSAVVRATPQQTGLALAVVFLLNGVALFTFPWIGRLFELTQTQFGLWAALAIHDTSSVVATAAIYGDEAAQVATTVKLGRTLWLIPLAFAISLMEQAALARRQGDAVAVRLPAPRLRVPPFILLFVAAAALAQYLELGVGQIAAVAGASKGLLVIALFLVGTELSRSTIRQLRGRIAWQALGLWLLVAPATLLAVRWLG
jgi:uncharacterized membrane protein YadS